MRASFLHVYTAAIPEHVGVGAVFPYSRSEEISACGSEKVQKEKYCAWKLLEFALLDGFGKRIEDISFTKSAQGKWGCDFCYFSLSHSENAVAIALSDSPVGVDIEKIAPMKNREKIAKKILTETEQEEYRRLAFDNAAANDFLLEIWTKKESLFKRGGFASFIPCRIPTDGTATKKLSFTDGEYFLSVAGKAGVDAVLHENSPYLP